MTNVFLLPDINVFDVIPVRDKLTTKNMSAVKNSCCKLKFIKQLQGRNGKNAGTGLRR